MIYTAKDSVVFGGNFVNNYGGMVGGQPESLIPDLRHRINDLHFSYAGAWYEEPQNTQFQYFLEGYDENWSNWTYKTDKEYTNLPTGDYVFRTKAKNAYGIISREATYFFNISPAWYQTIWAFIGYAVASILLVWSIVKLNVYRLEAEKMRLESIVQERTAEVVEQKEEIIQQHMALEQQKEEIETQNESISQQNTKLVALNEEKNHLIGILAHDMRNPLHQIKMMVALLNMKYKPSKEQVDDMKLIEQSADHLNNMINRILDLEAIESGKVNLNLSPYDLNHIINMVYDSMHHKAEEKNIELIRELKEGIPEVNIDADYLLQVVENLVSNALKFSPADKRVWLKLLQKEDEIQLLVQDEGQGISPADQEKLFGKFQKLSAQPTGGEKSTGLGLSIVKKYVEAMNGNVWCESELGQGASFIVSFKRG